jgi:putative transposase
MARMTRLKYADPANGYYHVISRSVLGSFLLNDENKTYFIRQLRKLSQVYFVRIVTYSVLSNHFHLVIGMLDSNNVSDSELRQRFELYYNNGIPAKRKRKFDPLLVAMLRKRWADLSCFIQDLKQRFSRWYNRKSGGGGHFWSDRFKSILLQSGRALLACSAYVDLNSVRAGLVERPENYRYCGLSQMVTGGREANWLDYSPIEAALFAWGFKINGLKDVINKYLEIIYLRGGREKEGQGSIPEKEKIRSLLAISFHRRIRHFTDGVVLGNEEFCEKIFREFRTFFQRRREIHSYQLMMEETPLSGLKPDLYTLRKFRL